MQAGIDLKDALGGGEVWVRAGGPWTNLTGSYDVTLLHLRDGVAVLGGFAGTERRASDRDPTSRTVIQGNGSSPDNDAVPLITGIGITNAELDGFLIANQEGPALALDQASDVQVRNVTIANSWHHHDGLIHVTDSDVRFEALRVTDASSQSGVPGISASGSVVRVTDSEFLRSQISVSGASAAVAATNSTLVLQGVRFEGNESNVLGEAAALRAVDSDVLISSSVWLGNGGDRGVLVANGSHIVDVDSHWEGNGGIAGVIRLLQGSTATFLNTSFVGNSTAYEGSVTATDSDLAIFNASFVDNLCTYPRHAYPDDVSFSGTSQVSVYNSYSNRGSYSIYGSFTGAGNCLLESTPYRETTPAGIEKVLLLSEFGCSDSGDATATEGATTEASAFAASLGATLPLTGNWWLTRSSVYGAATDTSPIDPGRHY